MTSASTSLWFVNKKNALGLGGSLVGQNMQVMQ